MCALAGIIVSCGTVSICDLLFAGQKVGFWIVLSMLVRTLGYFRVDRGLDKVPPLALATMPYVKDVARLWLTRAMPQAVAR